MSDITVSETPDQKTYTLTFAPGWSFKPGDQGDLGLQPDAWGFAQEDAGPHGRHDGRR